MLERFFGLLGSDLAIDLGTANTLIGVAGEGVILDEPSVVAVEEGTTRVVAGGRAVGHLAKQMLGRTPGSISVVRPLSAGVITDFELCEAMLRYFFEKAQRGAWSRGPRVLVAVPGSITPVEKRAVYNSAHRAGARQVFLVSEAIAAAVGAGLPITEPVASMICDIGGGTTEVAVLSLGDVVASTSVRVGGDRMDQAIQDYLRRRHNLRIGMATAEQLRIDIGSAAPLDKELSTEVRGVDATTGLPRRFDLSSVELREALYRAARRHSGRHQNHARRLQPRSGRRPGRSWHHGLSAARRCCGSSTCCWPSGLACPPRLPAARSIVATGMLTFSRRPVAVAQMLQSSDDDV